MFERIPKERLGRHRLGPCIDERFDVWTAIGPCRYKAPGGTDNGIWVIIEDRQLRLGGGRIIRRPSQLSGDMGMEAFCQGRWHSLPW